MFELSAVNRLSGKEFNGYLRIRLPHELDSVLETVVKEYRSGADAVRCQILDLITPRAAEVLSCYGRRAASMAVRARSVDILTGGLIAMSLADGRLEDYRSNLIVLAAVNHSADMLGHGLGELLDGVGPDLPAGAQATFRNFDARQPRDKTLQSMNLQVLGSGDSFLYR